MRLKLSEKIKTSAPARKIGLWWNACRTSLKLPGLVKLSVPTRKIVLLPDGYFFCRAVPISEEATPAEASTQIELALETLSPFPPAQMYHGHFWWPGTKNACVFAAYRKRFTAEQVESWADAEAVLPSFASMLCTPIKRPTTLLLWSEKGLTAVNWNDVNDAPVSVISRELPLEPTPTDRANLREAVLRESELLTDVPVFAPSGAALRDTLVHKAGGTRAIVETSVTPVFDETAAGDEFVFRADPLNAAFTREQLDVLDVRDKEELAARRRVRSRDLLLWRVLLGCATAIALSLLLEIGLIAGGLWQKGRTMIVDRQEPGVAKILTAKNLASRIDELSTRRMRPFEMISLVAAKKPDSVTFDSATVTNLYTLDVEAKAATSSDLEAFRSALNTLAGCESVEFKGNRLVNGITTFRVVVTFRPDAFNVPPES